MDKSTLNYRVHFGGRTYKLQNTSLVTFHQAKTPVGFYIAKPQVPIFLFSYGLADDSINRSKYYESIIFPALILPMPNEFIRHSGEADLFKFFAVQGIGEWIFFDFVGSILNHPNSQGSGCVSVASLLCYRTK